MPFINIDPRDIKAPVSSLLGTRPQMEMYDLNNNFDPMASGLPFIDAPQIEEIGGKFNFSYFRHWGRLWWW